MGQTEHEGAEHRGDRGRPSRRPVRGRLAVGLVPGVAAVDIPSTLRDLHQQYPHARLGPRGRR
ncbi:hypothetical protein AB0903_13135 [Streptomyces sp. NPDC048389]|uniref:hypothetical protein n=1 Tax=Streptomyces sp. NPDC048389 TaxID=3154622 RepID=UPI003454C03C